MRERARRRAQRKKASSEASRNVRSKKNTRQQTHPHAMQKNVNLKKKSAARGTRNRDKPIKLGKFLDYGILEVLFNKGKAGRLPLN